MDKHIEWLGQSAYFENQNFSLDGYVTAIQIYKVNNVPTLFIGGNENNIPGNVSMWFQPNEVSLFG